ncbi:MAG: hypothetical protein PHN80_16260 [Hespellia sp.]|nr:hypothetical protein [Hespellia sp.]
MKKLELIPTRGHQTYAIYEKWTKAATYGVAFIQTVKSKKLELIFIGGYCNVPLWLRAALPVTIKTDSRFTNINR